MRSGGRRRQKATVCPFSARTSAKIPHLSAAWMPRGGRTHILIRANQPLTFPPARLLLLRLTLLVSSWDLQVPSWDLQVPSWDLQATWLESRHGQEKITAYAAHGDP